MRQGFACVLRHPADGSLRFAVLPTSWDGGIGGIFGLNWVFLNWALALLVGIRELELRIYPVATN